MLKQLWLNGVHITGARRALLLLRWPAPATASTTADSS